MPHEMKDIFWEIDPVCGYTYSVYKQEKYADQPHLVPAEPDYSVLTRQLRAHLAGKSLTIGELEEYIFAETPFRITEYKERVLCPLERSARIRVTPANPTLRPGEYAKNDLLYFF